MAPTLDCELIWLGQSLRSDFLLFPDFTHTVFHHSVVLSGIFLFVAQWVFHHLVYLQLSVVESNILLPFCQNWRQIFIENDPLRLENLTFSLVEETVVAFSCGTLSYSSTDGKTKNIPEDGGLCWSFSGSGCAFHVSLEMHFRALYTLLMSSLV